MSAFFKNLLVYRLTQAVEITHEALETKSYREPASQELSTYGFIAPYGTELCLPVQCGALGYATVIAAKRTERILPGSVVKEAVAKKVAEIEAQQSRKVYKAEKDQLKDEIVMALLPQAFCRHKVTHAMIVGDLILVDASSAKQAEDLLSTLREAIGSLPCRPVSVKSAPNVILTEWLKAEQAAEGFHVLDECELKDLAEDGGIVRVKHEDLTGDEIKEHLNVGKMVTKLALAFEDKLSFVLDDKLTIKRLKFEDLLQEAAKDDGGEDEAGQLQASYAIMAYTLNECFKRLTEAFGGEEIPQSL